MLRLHEAESGVVQTMYEIMLLSVCWRTISFFIQIDNVNGHSHAKLWLTIRYATDFSRLVNIPHEIAASQ